MDLKGKSKKTHNLLKNNTRRMKSLHAARFVYLESLLLVQSPGKAVFCIFYLKAKVG